MSLFIVGNEIKINGVGYSAPSLKMIELYDGKKPEWKGWHNLILKLSDEPGEHKALAGPIDPETSLEIKTAIKALSNQ